MSQNSISSPNQILIIVGKQESINNFLESTIIQNDFGVVFVDNTKSTFESKQEPTFVKDLNDLPILLDVDIVNLMFDGFLKSEFHNLLVGISLVNLLEEYQQVTVITANSISLTRDKQLKIVKDKNNYFEPRINSYQDLQFSNSRNIIDDVLRFGPISSSIIKIRDAQKMIELGNLIIKSLETTGDAYEIFKQILAFANLNSLIKITDVEHCDFITPWNFEALYSESAEQNQFLDKNYFDEGLLFWGVDIPSGLDSSRLVESYKLLKFSLEDIQNLSKTSLENLTTQNWSSFANTRLVSAYIANNSTNEYNTHFQTKFVTWLLLDSGKFGITNFEYLIWDMRPDLQARLKANSSDFIRVLRNWLIQYCFLELGEKQIYKEIKSNIMGKNQNPKKIKQQPGFNIIGYPKYFSGLGKAARDYKKLIEDIGIQTSSLSMVNNLSEIVQSEEIKEKGLVFDKNFLIVGADQLNLLDTLISPNWNNDRYNIGCFFWETEKFPEHSTAALNLFDEFIVSSNYIKSVLEKHTKKNISVVGLPIEALSRLDHKESKEVKIFFNFDFLSDIYRKNVFTLVEYINRIQLHFKEFDISCTIKSTNGAFFPLEFAALRNQIAKSNNIRLIEKNLSFSDYRNLILESNLYISLHRSEGFGLGMAEFMGKGIPVIATNYSGNLDFMNKENSWLVDYELVDVRDSVNSAYKRFGGLWAEPKFESFQLNFENYLYSKNRIDKIENARKTIEAEYGSELLRNKLTSIFSKSGVL